MAVTFWVVYPLFHNKKIIIFCILSILEILISTLIEFMLTINTQIVVYTKIASVQKSQVVWTLFFNLLFRNSGLICFAGLMAFTTELKIRLFEKDSKLFRLKRQLMVNTLSNKPDSLMLDVDKICYVQQKGNYSYIYTFDGLHFIKRSSLKEVQDLFSNENFIKISRNTIVRLSSIKTFTDNEVWVQKDKGLDDVCLTIGAFYAPSVLPVIQEAFRSEKTVSNETQDHRQQSENSSLDIPLKSKAIYQYIKDHPKCKLNEIVVSTHIPKSTITRHLQNLQKEDLIQYVGNKRTGGYMVVDKGPIDTIR